MADIFMTAHIKSLLAGKYVLLMGGSNMRATYRDILWLLNNNKVIPESHLRRKLDFSYLGDRLVKQGQLNRGRDYIEMREYKKDEFHVKFNFITRCLTKEIEEMMNEFKEKKTSPDVLLINSCLWDITRWGPDGVHQYKDNMRKLFSLFKESLPPTTLVIFTTTIPVSPSCNAAFLVKQVEFMKHSLRFEVMEANLFARQLVPTYGYNILDIHYHLRMQIHRRCKDGVHWFPLAVRHMTNLFLTHISLCWDAPLPGNFEGKLITRMKERVKGIKDVMEDTVLPKLSMVKELNMPPPRLPVRKVRRRKSGREIRRNVENITPKMNAYSTYPRNPDPQYAGGWVEKNSCQDPGYPNRKVFGQGYPNVRGLMIPKCQNQGYFDHVQNSNAEYVPYNDYQSHEYLPHRYGLSCDGNGTYENNYGPQRYRNSYHYASHMRPY